MTTSTSPPATMTIDDDRPTLAERYGGATRSSQLRAEEGRCDIDYLIAAGLAVDGMGSTLMRLRAEFDAVRPAVRSGAMNRTEMFLVLSRLKSLSAARDELGRFAVAIATKRLFMQPDTTVYRIAGRVLDVWLDPTCHACEGRGFNGGQYRGEQVIRCGGCRGFGQRRSILGDTAEEKRFSHLLLDAMAEALNRTEAEMRRRLREHLTD